MFINLYIFFSQAKNLVVQNALDLKHPTALRYELALEYAIQHCSKPVPSLHKKGKTKDDLNMM